MKILVILDTLIVISADICLHASSLSTTKVYLPRGNVCICAVVFAFSAVYVTQ